MVKELVTEGLPLGVLVAESVERIRREVLATLLNQRLVAILVAFELWNMI